MSKTTIEIVDNPSVQSHTLFGDQSDFLAAMRAGNFVYVDVHPHTKTSVYLSLHLEPHRYGANSVRVDSLKYLEKREVNMMQGVTYTAYYLKAKSLEDIQKHIEAVLAHYFPSLELEGFTLKFYNTARTEELARWKIPPYAEYKRGK